MKATRLTALLGTAVLAAIVLVLAGCGGAQPDDSKLLEGKTWKAVEISGKSAEASADVTAKFANGDLSGSGGVNSYGGTYVAEKGDQIAVSPGASTLMAGPPALMSQESAYFAALALTTSYKVSADSLELFDSSGKILVRFVVLK